MQVPIIDNISLKPTSTPDSNLISTHVGKLVQNVQYKNRSSHELHIYAIVLNYNVSWCSAFTKMLFKNFIIHMKILAKVSIFQKFSISMTTGLKHSKNHGFPLGPNAAYVTDP